CGAARWRSRGARRRCSGRDRRARCRGRLVRRRSGGASEQAMPDSASNLNAERLAAARRLVIKVGSALFVDQQTGTLDRPWLEGLCEDVAALRTAGKEVVVVSSGAVALGVGELGLDPRRARLDDKQAA